MLDADVDEVTITNRRGAHVPGISCASMQDSHHANSSLALLACIALTLSLDRALDQGRNLSLMTAHAKTRTSEELKRGLHKSQDN